MLFKSFESIYNSGRDDLYVASTLYEQLACKFNRNNINQKLKIAYKDNDYYIYRNNHHAYHNKYRGEDCDLEIKNSYIICNANTSKMEILKKLKGYNLFVCDFENKDYFWLDEIYC